MINNSSNSNNHRATNRVLDILELLANNLDGMYFSEIASALNIPKSSLFPIIHTLRNRNYIKYIEREQRYYMGKELFYLGNKYVKDSSLLTQINTVISNLSKAVEQTSYFGVLTGGNVLYLLRASAPSTFQVIASQGYHFKAYSTGIGKSLLCDLELDELKNLYPEGLTPVTKNTILCFDVLYNQLLNIRKTGFGYEKEESTPHIQCVSTPIRYNNAVIAAISVAFPVFSYTPEYERFIEEEITKAKDEIENIISNNINKWIYSDLK